MIVKYVRKSTITRSLLKEDAIKSRDPARVLAPASVGKTRFASKWSSMVTLAPHLQSLQRMVESEKITIQVCLIVSWKFDFFTHLIPEKSGRARLFQ